MGKIFSATLCGEQVAVKTVRTSPTPLECWNASGDRSDRNQSSNSINSPDYRTGCWSDCESSSKNLEERCRQLQHEIGILSSLTHPNVVSFVACSMSQDHILLVTELLPLGSMYHFLRSSHAEFSYDARDAFAFACDVAAGCKHLHKQGIIRCDLKTANVLVARCPAACSERKDRAERPRFRAKITDFGCAVWTSKKQQGQ